jgi:hypothetical protein
LILRVTLINNHLSLFSVRGLLELEFISAGAKSRISFINLTKEKARFSQHFELWIIFATSTKVILSLVD